jgi:hypothetical protein
LTGTTDNGVITLNGSAPNATVESNLTFDGTVLSISTNNAKFLQGGDDSALYDVNLANTLGIHGQQDSTVGAIKLGSSGQVIYSNATGVGIGTITPGVLLHVQGAYSGSTATFTGNVTALSLTETSTIALKDNVRTLEDISITELEPVRFIWKDSQKEDIGLIAEQVAPLFPELVEFDDKGNPIGVHYSRLTVLLLKSIKSLTNEIEELKRKL